MTAKKRGMLIVYPFVQKYFEKGFMAGALKAFKDHDMSHTYYGNAAGSTLLHRI